MKGARAAEDTTTPDTIKAKWPKDKLVAQLSNYMRLNNILPPTALPRPRPPGAD